MTDDEKKTAETEALNLAKSIIAKLKKGIHSITLLIYIVSILIILVLPE